MVGSTTFTFRYNDQPSLRGKEKLRKLTEPTTIQTEQQEVFDLVIEELEEKSDKFTVGDLRKSMGEYGVTPYVYRHVKDLLKTRYGSNIVMTGNADETIVYFQRSVEQLLKEFSQSTQEDKSARDAKIMEMASAVVHNEIMS